MLRDYFRVYKLPDAFVIVHFADRYSGFSNILLLQLCIEHGCMAVNRNHVTGADVLKV